MSRSAISLVVFVLAFAIGSIPTLILPVRDHNGSELQTTELVESTQADEPQGFKYGCPDQETVSFWELLDKEQFLRQQRAQMTKRDAERVEKDFDQFQQTFSCSYFLGVSLEDLNGDGVDELKVQGEGGMRDWPTYIFQRTNLGLRMILAEAWTFEEDHPQTRHHGFRDLVYHSNYSGRYREITNYQYDGHSYVPKKCISEDHLLNRKGDMIPVDYPIFKNISCSPASRVQR